MTRKASLFSVIKLRKWSSTSLNQRNFIPLLNICDQSIEITQIHAKMIKNGHDQIPFYISKLLAASVTDTEYAESIFQRVESPNVFMFNTMLRSYSGSKVPKQALFLFKGLRSRGILIDQFSFICVLKACAQCLAIPTGRTVHGLLILCGLELFLNVRNTLLRFYCASQRFEDGRQLFDEFPHQTDVVSWNILIGSCLRVAKPSAAIDLIIKMHATGFVMNVATMLSGLSACCDLEDLLGGKSLHGYCIKTGFCSELNVVTAIVNVYAKNGRVDLGRKMFDEIPKRDVVLWNCIIDGYSKKGLLGESLNILQLMKRGQVKPNSATLAGLLSACASLGSFAIGKYIHSYVEEELLELDAVLGTALIDMYSKCGSLEKAVDIFDKTKTKDVKCWTAMIIAYSLHGKAEEAIQLFHVMETAEGASPNEVTFLAVLIACCHGGLVMEGKNCFKRMVTVHGLTPNIKHYSCMIDLLGRAGLLQEAYELIRCLPIEKDATIWRTLLAACRIHGHAELGEVVRRVLVGLDAEHPTDSILLSSTYAVAGRWADVARMRKLEEDISMKKEVGFSLIEMDC